eukprot:GHVT01103676.1.p1 GENE.GHVT01103676.1~~GHVT01103676.1.p1  ORF type:complete len:454 (+),score=82.13 GHVT01103676.1:199-1560(+)
MDQHKQLQCLRVTKSMPISVCPPNAAMDHSGKCRITAPVERVCPPGFSPIESKKSHGGKKHDHPLVCALVKSVPAIPTCPDGSPSHSGMCPWSSSSPVHLECPNGGGKKHKHHGGKKQNEAACVTLRSIPPVPVCPPATFFKKGVCLGERPAPCPLKASKKGGYGKQMHHENHHSFQDDHHSFQDDHHSFQDDHSFQDNYPSHQGGYPYQEEDYLTDAAFPSADFDPRLDSGFDYAPNFPSHYGAASLPVYPEASPAVRRLGKKSSKKHGPAPLTSMPSKKMCSAPVALPPTFVCPPSSISSGKKKHGHGGKKDHGDLYCAVAEPLAPIPMCSTPGAVISSDGHSCLSHGLVPAVPKCPAGFSECGAPKKKRHGHKKRDQLVNCCAHKSAPAVPVCPHGFVLEAHACVAWEHPTMVCQKGTMKHGKCVLKEIIPPIVEIMITRKSHTPVVMHK